MLGFRGGYSGLDPACGVVIEPIETGVRARWEAGALKLTLDLRLRGEGPLISALRVLLAEKPSGRMGKRRR